MNFMNDLLGGQGCDVNGVGRNPLADVADRLLSTGASLSNNGIMMMNNNIDEINEQGILMNNNMNMNMNMNMNNNGMMMMMGNNNDIDYNIMNNDMNMNNNGMMMMNNNNNNDMNMMLPINNYNNQLPNNMMMLQLQQNMMLMQMQQMNMMNMNNNITSSSTTTMKSLENTDIPIDLQDIIMNTAMNGNLTPDLLQQLVQQHGMSSIVPDKEYIANKNIQSWAEERELNAIQSSLQNGASKEGYEKAWKVISDKLEAGKDDTNYTFIEDNKYMQQQNQDSSLSLFERAMVEYKDGNIFEAIQLFEADVQQNTDRDESWRMLGVCQAENDEDKRAIVCLKRALEIDPYNLNALLELGISYVNELDSIKALQTLKEWVTNNPRFHGLHIAKDEYSDGTFMDEVMQLMLEVIKWAPNDPEVQIVLGVLYNVSQDYDDAVNCFSNAAKMNSVDHNIYNKIGATLANSNRSREAIPVYAKALEIRPRYARGWLNLGISYANMNKYNEAAKAYLQALYLNPQASHIWNYLRVVFTCMQRLDLVQQTGQNLQGLSHDALKQQIRQVLQSLGGGYELIE